MRTWSLRIAMLAVAFVAAAPVAFGQSGAAAPVAVGGMDVQIWPEAEPGATVVIASVNLEADQKLPATVRIPLIAGMDVQWVGEITGADPSLDPTRTYTIEKGNGGEYVEFQATENRFLQVEMIGLPVSVEGDLSKVTVPWVQSAPATATAFSVRTVAGARDVKIDPAPVGEAGTNDAGEALYTLPSERLKEGEKATVSVQYGLGTQFEGGLDGGDSNVVIWALLGGILVAAGFLIWTVWRQKPPVE